MRARNLILFTSVLALIFLNLSCSSGPKAPEKGTPAFYWSAAKETFAAGDYIKALDHLDRLTKIQTGNEYLAKAQPWYLVLASGMTQGYMDLADAFETGSNATKTGAAAFRRQMNDQRRLAKEITLPFFEHFEEFEKTNPAEVVLAFPYPSGTSAEPPTIGRLKSGILPPDAEIESAQKAMVQRAVVMAVARATGSGDDTAKSAALFKAEEVKVPKNDFMVAMASALYSDAALYDQKKLDNPDNMKLLLTHAKEALKGVPENKAVKELSGKIEKAEKRFKAS